MQSPHPLPTRRLSISTDSVESFASLQPERPRSIVQLHRGRYAIRLQEVAWGAAALQQESWSCGVRIQVDRPSGYDTFALPTCVEGDARWMGTSIERGSLLRIVEPWDMVTAGRFEYVGFSVGHAALAEARLRLEGPETGPLPERNHLGRAPDPAALGAELRCMLQTLEDDAQSDPAALRAAEQDLIHLAARLDRAPDPLPAWRMTSTSTRLALVRRVEEFLETCEDAPPSVAKLCEIAGSSERTLEYAFREHMGMTPVRYLKVRRLNLARRRLQQPVTLEASVTSVALACGFYDLGRFAGEYRQLFGELPSATLGQSGSRQRTGFPSRRDDRAPHARSAVDGARAIRAWKT